MPVRRRAVPQPVRAQGLRDQLLPAVPPRGRLGGNVVQAPHNNLVEALGTRFVAPDAFEEDVRVPHKYNRLLLYNANLIHSATGYSGTTLEEKRMTAVFFWMA